MIIMWYNLGIKYGDVMEILIEALIELFGEIILTALAEVIGTFARKVEANNLLRKGLKLGLKYSILTLTIILITLSLIYKKGFLVIIAVSYMLAILLITLVVSLNRDIWQNRIVRIIIEIIKRIVHYIYPILLIIFGALYLTNTKAKASLIIICVVAIILWFSVDMFRVWRYNLNKERQRKQELKEKETDVYSL